MSTPSETPPGTPPVEARGLSLVRTGAGMTILAVVGLVGILAFRPPTNGLGTSHAGAAATIGFPALLPYLLILFWLRGKAQGKALSLAQVTGWSGLLPAAFGFLVGCGDQGRATVLLLPQVLLLIGARRAQADLRLQTGDQRRVIGGGALQFLGLIPLFSFFFLSLSPPSAFKSREAASQASAVGSLRTINTSETTYAATYSTGFSATLAALDGADGATATAESAGLIDSILGGGTKSQYRFVYAPGPRNKKGQITTYSVTASPIQGTGNGNFYYTDQSGVIRWNPRRTATAQDPPLAG